MISPLKALRKNHFNTVLIFISMSVSISYYNVLLFRELTKMRDIRSIGIAMVAVGWGAASAANAVALYHQL